MLEQFTTPSSDTPKVPGKLPILPQPVNEELENDSEMLIQLTNDLNKAIRQRDFTAFQYVCDVCNSENISCVLLGNCVILKSLILIQKLVQC